MKRLTCDTIEDELERNLMQVDQGLESVKNLAVEMHVQLKMQEPKLNRIEELTETNDCVVEGVNDKVKKLLH
uniref:t-SNARE coiled-coil homology domain-containing protein n=1 Tax=Caenorhabditis tropicalis TaxID=1561998 RepID=A0A1I7UQ41_9PELO